MQFLHSLLFVLFGIIACNLGFAQPNQYTPVSWSFEVTENPDHSYNFIATATIAPHWAMYSQFSDEDGPIPLSFSYDSKGLIGSTEEISEPIKEYSKLFEVNVIKFKEKAVFRQKFIPQAGQKSFKGSLEYMVCDEKRCLPPSIVDFDLPL